MPWNGCGSAGPGEAASTYSCDPAEVDGLTNLDFDASGRLLGVEVLDASRKLAAELLSQAESQLEAERRRGR